MKKHSSTFFVAILFLALAPITTAHAATFLVGQTVAIPKDRIEADNLYLGGGQVSVSTTVQKDVVAAGGTVIVNGPVWGDALLVGGTVNVLNDVKGDVRIAGGQIIISGLVGGDVVVGGGRVTLLPGSVVTGDVIVGGGKIDLEGTVNGEVHLYGGDVAVNGLVAGAAVIKAGKSLSIGEKAIFGKSLSYSAPNEATIATGAKVGTNVTFTKAGGDRSKFSFGLGAGLLAFLGVLVLIKFIATLATALAAQYLFPRFTMSLSQEFVQKFWKSALVGFIGLVVTPIACILLALTGIGIYFALILGALYFLAILFGGIAMGIFTGALLAKWVKKEVEVTWYWTVLGTALVFIIWLIPVVGWLLLALLFFASFGVITMSMRRDAEAKM